jgi:hypothetical protein
LGGRGGGDMRFAPAVTAEKQHARPGNEPEMAVRGSDIGAAHVAS